MIFINMLAQTIAFQHEFQHGPTKMEYDLVGMILFFVAIFFSILAIVVIVKRYFAMKVKRDIVALIAEGKITADEAQKLMPKKSKL